jgi:hypothetical protein
MTTMSPSVILAGMRLPMLPKISASGGAAGRRGRDRCNSDVLAMVGNARSASLASTVAAQRPVSSCSSHSSICWHWRNRALSLMTWVDDSPVEVAASRLGARRIRRLFAAP